METIKKQLIEKLGEENVAVIEEAVRSATADVCKEVVDLKTEVTKLNKQKGFLNRKIASQAKLFEQQLKDKLEEQKDKIIKVSQKYVDDEINKREEIIESLTSDNQKISIQLAERFEKFFNDDVYPKVQQLVEEKHKEDKQAPLMERISRSIRESLIKSKKSTQHLDEVKALKAKVASLQESTASLAKENSLLKNKIVLLKETKELSEKEVEEISETSKDKLDSKEGYDKIVREAKRRILERKRRSLRKVNVDESARKSPEKPAVKQEPMVVNEAISQRILDLI